MFLLHRVSLPNLQRTPMEPSTFWTGSVRFQERKGWVNVVVMIVYVLRGSNVDYSCLFRTFRPYGKEDYSSFEWSSRMIIHQHHPNASLSLLSFIPTSILQELYVWVCWMKKRIGDQQSLSNRSFSVSRISLTNLTSRILLRLRHTLSFGEYIYSISSFPFSLSLSLIYRHFVDSLFDTPSEQILSIQPTLLPSSYDEPKIIEKETY